MSYTDRLRQVEILPLEFLREKSDLIFLFKCKNGLIPMNTSQYFSNRIHRANALNYDTNNLFPTKIISRAIFVIPISQDAANSGTIFLPR